MMSFIFSSLSQLAFFQINLALLGYCYRNWLLLMLELYFAKYIQLGWNNKMQKGSLISLNQISASDKAFLKTDFVWLRSFVFSSLPYQMQFSILSILKSKIQPFNPVLKRNLLSPPLFCNNLHIFKFPIQVSIPSSTLSSPPIFRHEMRSPLSILSTGYACVYISFCDRSKDWNYCSILEFLMGIKPLPCIISPCP